MTEFSGFVLENSVDRGWRTFEHWLATVLSGMIDGDVLVVARESGDGEPGRDKQPHVQFCAWGDDLLRAEAASNRHLRPAVRADRDPARQHARARLQRPAGHRPTRWRTAAPPTSTSTCRGPRRPTSRAARSGRCARSTASCTPPSCRSAATSTPSSTTRTRSSSCCPRAAVARSRRTRRACRRPAPWPRTGA